MGTLVRYCAKLAWLAALAVALAFLFRDTALRLARLQAASAAHSEESTAPAADPQSPTGYALGERNAILQTTEADGYQWIIETQRLLRPALEKQEKPERGQSLHRSDGFAGWMALVARIDHARTGIDLALCAERAAIWAPPALLGLFLLVLVPLTAWRLGSEAASVLALAGVAALPVSGCFSAGFPTHEGAAAMLALATLLFLLLGGGGMVLRASSTASPGSPAEKFLLGWLRKRTVARRWFVASAITGGIGLWVDAPVEAAALGGIALGVAVCTALTGRGIKQRRTFWKPDPSLWLSWAAVGAGTSLILYVAENFPRSWELPPEANNPLYALAWLGAGDLLRRYGRWQRRKSVIRSPIDAGLCAASAALCLALPVAVTMKAGRGVAEVGTARHAFSTNFIDQLHTLAQLGNPSFLPVAALAFLVPALGTLSLLLLLDSRIHSAWKALIALAAVPALTGIAITLIHAPLLPFTNATALAALAVSTFTVARPTGFAGSKTTVIATASAAAAGALLLAAYPLALWRGGQTSAAPLDPQIALRDVAHQLRQRLGGGNAVILGDPATMNAVTYFGGFRNPGAVVWKNPVAFGFADRILAAFTDDDALKRIQHLGYTHLVDFQPAQDAAPAAETPEKESAETEPAEEISFLKRVRAGQTPDWLRPVPIRDPRGFRARVYEIAPNQSHAEALVRTAQFEEESGNPSEVETTLRDALQAESGNLPALIALASHYYKARSKEPFGKTMEEIQSRLPGADKLELGDRVALANVLLASGDEKNARRQFTDAVQAADEAAIRRLAPSELSLYLLLSNQWDVPPPGGFPLESAAALLPVTEQAKYLTWDARNQLGRGETRRALSALAKAVKLRPQYAPALSGLAWILATTPDDTLRDGRLAVEFAARAVATAPDDPGLLDVLACAHAAAGNFDEAAAQEQRAVENAAGDSDGYRQRLGLFRKGQPYVASPAAKRE